MRSASTSQILEPSPQGLISSTYIIFTHRSVYALFSVFPHLVLQVCAIKRRKSRTIRKATGSNTLNLCNDIFSKKIAGCRKKVLTDGSKGDKD